VLPGKLLGIVVLMETYAGFWQWVLGIQVYSEEWIILSCLNFQSTPFNI
jgi:hypothetical protein